MSVDTQRQAWATSTRSAAPSKVTRTIGEPTIRMVWLCLSWHANSEGVAWPSLATLADETEVDERTVRAAIEKLVERGMLELVRRGGRHQGASHYRILIPSTGQHCPPETAAQPGNSAHLSAKVNRAVQTHQPGSSDSQPGNSAHQTPRNANRTPGPAPGPTYLGTPPAHTDPPSGRQVTLPEHLAELRSRGVSNPTEFTQLDPARIRQVLADWDADPEAGPGALVTRLRDLAAGRGYTPPAALTEPQARRQRVERRLAAIQAEQHDHRAILPPAA